MDFGQRLKEVRKQHGLSQVELAEILGSHSVTLSRWERSVDYPTILVLARIASLFHVSADYLLGLSATTGDIDCSAAEKDVDACTGQFSIKVSVLLEAAGMFHYNEERGMEATI